MVLKIYYENREISFFLYQYQLYEHRKKLLYLMSFTLVKTPGDGKLKFEIKKDLCCNNFNPFVNS